MHFWLLFARDLVYQIFFAGLLLRHQLLFNFYRFLCLLNRSFLGIDNIFLVIRNFLDAFLSDKNLFIIIDQNRLSECK